MTEFQIDLLSKSLKDYLSISVSKKKTSEIKINKVSNHKKKMNKVQILQQEYFYYNGVIKLEDLYDQYLIFAIE